MLPGGLSLVASLRLNETDEKVIEKPMCSEKAYNLLQFSIHPTDLPCFFFKGVSPLDVSNEVIDGLAPSFASDSIPYLEVEGLTPDMEQFTDDYHIPTTSLFTETPVTPSFSSSSIIRSADLPAVSETLQEPLKPMEPIISELVSTSTPTKPIKSQEVPIADLSGSELASKIRQLLQIQSTEKSFVNNIANRGIKLNNRGSQWGIIDETDMTHFHEIIPHMAQNFPFELDDFQKRSIVHLERGESVYVCAHTSAGKTVVADYAISLCQQHMTKCIYTSPVKALSNQKYHDFKHKYEDVGIITGDVSVNPTAGVLIMTTEILREMLYNGSDVIRDVEWVVFDEAHYINDSDRGVVWEESIILMPDHINMIFLSATTPNVQDIADWIGRTKQKKVFIMETQMRPVPLQYDLIYENKVTTVLLYRSINF